MSDNPRDFSEFRTGPSLGSQGAPGGVPFGEPAYVPAGESALGAAGPWSAGETEPGLVVARPPLWILAAAAALAAVALALALVGGERPSLALLAWVLAGPAGFTALSVFTTVDTRQRSRSVYAAPAWLRTGYWTCVVLLLVALLASAFRIAEWVGRL